MNGEDQVDETEAATNCGCTAHTEIGPEERTKHLRIATLQMALGFYASTPVRDDDVVAVAKKFFDFIEGK